MGAGGGGGGGGGARGGSAAAGAATDAAAAVTTHRRRRGGRCARATHLWVGGLGAMLGELEGRRCRLWRLQPSRTVKRRGGGGGRGADAHQMLAAMPLEGGPAQRPKQGRAGHHRQVSEQRNQRPHAGDAADDGATHPAARFRGGRRHRVPPPSPPSAGNPPKPPRAARGARQRRGPLPLRRRCGVGGRGQGGCGGAPSGAAPGRTVPPRAAAPRQGGAPATRRRNRRQAGGVAPPPRAC